MCVGGVSPPGFGVGTGLSSYENKRHFVHLTASAVLRSGIG